jgi:hypothetical protein
VRSPTTAVITTVDSDERERHRQRGERADDDRVEPEGGHPAIAPIVERLDLDACVRRRRQTIGNIRAVSRLA